MAPVTLLLIERFPEPSTANPPPEVTITAPFADVVAVGIRAVSKVPLVIFEAANEGISLAPRPLTLSFEVVPSIASPPPSIFTAPKSVRVAAGRSVPTMALAETAPPAPVGPATNYFAP